MSFKVIGLGEILWDLLPVGKQLGGAPANFACQARALGAEAGLVTRIGNDPLGGETLERLRALGLPTDCVAVDMAAVVAVAGDITVVVEAVVRVAADLKAAASAGIKQLNSRRFSCGSFSIQLILPVPEHRPTLPVLMANNKVHTFLGRLHSGSPLPG